MTLVVAATLSADERTSVTGIITRLEGSHCTVSVGSAEGLTVGQRLYVQNLSTDHQLELREVGKDSSVAIPAGDWTGDGLVLGAAVSTSPGNPTSTSVASVPSAQTGDANATVSPPSVRSGAIVRIEGHKLWLSAGEDQGLRQGMVGEVRHQDQDPVRVLLTDSWQEGSIAELVPTQQVETKAQPLVTLGETVTVTAATPAETRHAAAAVSGRRFTETSMTSFWPGSGAQGSTGLINVPVADTVGEGNVTLGYTETQGYNPVTRSEGRLGVHYLNLGFLPHVEISGRFTRRDITPTSPAFDRLDRSASVRFQPLEETDRLPAVALGMDDIAGNRITRAAYLVGSKRVGGARLHVGYGQDRLDGVFAGAEARVTPQTSLMAEWDTAHFNSGLRWRLSDSLNLDAHFLAMRDLRFGINYTAHLGDRDAAQSESADSPYQPRRDVVADFDALAQETQRGLVAADFEDVTVEVWQTNSERFPGPLVRVTLADRTRPRTPLAGFAEALWTVARRLPRNVRSLSLTMLASDVPSASFTTRVDDYFKFMNRRLSADMYRTRVLVTLADDAGLAQSGAGDALIGAGTTAAASSRLRTDLSLRPMLGYDLGRASDILRTRGVIAAEAETRLARGAFLDLQFRQDLWNEFNQVNDRENLHVRQAVVRTAWRLGERAFAQATTGYFSTQTYGISGEVIRTTTDGSTSIGLQANSLGTGFDDLGHQSVLVDVAHRVPALDLTARLRYGRFLGADTGAEVSLDRWFGHHRLGLIGASTDYGSYGGVRLSIPFGPSRRQSPSSLRAQVGDHFNWAYYSNPDQDRGKRLETGHELEEVVLHGGRLSPTYILQHVERLRNVRADVE